MATKKTIEISVEAKEAIKTMGELESSFEDVFGEVQPLNTKIGEMEDTLYRLAEAGEQNSQEFKDLTAQVGAMRKIIIDTDLAVDGMAQTTAQKLGGALGGVTAGFELGAGAMGAFGVESAQVEEALLKVQSAMAISQGIQGIKEAIPSFVALKSTILSNVAALNLGTVASKAMSMAMKSIPIVALAAAALAVAEALRKWTINTLQAEEATATLAEQHERLNQILEQQQKAIDKITAANSQRWSQELELLEASGASEQDIHDKKMENLEKERKQTGIQRDLALKAIESQRLALSEARRTGQTELAESLADELQASKDRYNQLNLQHKDYVHQKKIEDINYRKEQQKQILENAKELDDQRKSDLEKHRAYLEKKRGIEREVEDAILSMKFDNEAKAQEANNLAFEREKEDILLRTDLTEQQKLTLIEAAEHRAWQRRQEIAAQYQAEMDAVLAEERPMKEEMELAQLTSHEDAKAAVLDEYRQKQLDKDAEAAEQRKALLQQGFDSASSFLTSLDELNTMLTDDAVKKAGKNEAAAEKARKKGFERSKKLQLTMAIIQGVQGVMAAFTAGSSMGPAGVVMGPLMAALAAVTAGINIAKISKMKYEGGGSGGGGGGGGSAPRAPSVPNPASFNVVGNDGTNQLADTLGEQPPIKAQVVSEEVTSQQSLDRNRKNNASFG